MFGTTTSKMLLNVIKRYISNGKKHDRPNDPTNSLVIRRKETRKIFTRKLRLEENKRRHEERNRIINANSDKRLFFKLVKKQSKNGNVLIDDLYVNDNLYHGSDVVNGWHEHFSILAQPSNSDMYDYANLNLCDLDYQTIKEICDGIPPRTVSIDEISTAIKSINTGKAEDILGMSIENILFAGNEFLNHLCTLINYIFSNRLIPDVIKTGLLSTVYKNKGNNHQSKNYRGIVVLPVFIKIIEYIVRTDLKPLLLQNQSV